MSATPPENLCTLRRQQKWNNNEKEKRKKNGRGRCGRVRGREKLANIFRKWLELVCALALLGLDAVCLEVDRRAYALSAEQANGMRLPRAR